VTGATTLRRSLGAQGSHRELLFRDFVLLRVRAKTHKNASARGQYYFRVLQLEHNYVYITMLLLNNKLPCKRHVMD
jgi:hypothetical protein